VSAPTQVEEELGKAYDARLMRRLLVYLRPYWGVAAVAVLILIAASALQIVGPFITKMAIDDAIPTGDRRLLGILVSAYVGILLVVFALQYVQSLLTTWLGQRIMFDLRHEIFGHLQKLDLRFYDRNPVGRLMTRITNDVETLNELFSSGIVTVFGDIFTLAFIVSAMLWINFELALVTLSVLPFVGVAAFLFRSRIRGAYRDIRVRLARINAYLHERVTGVRVVQLFNREPADQSEFERIDREYLSAHLRSVRYYALFFPVIEVFTAIALALIVWRGGIGVVSGAISVGTVAAFLQYARRFFRPIQDLSEKYNVLQGAMASSERVFKLLDRRPAVADPPNPSTLPVQAAGTIEFRGVWFAYGEKDGGAPDWVLEDVSFRVEAGEKVAIVGHTGAGKTTVINLLTRFYDPQRGTILLDGVDIRELALADLRGRIGLVLQDVFLFSRDIGYNIRMGDARIDDEAVIAAAREVGAAPFVERLPDGYQQALGERGASLSVGERQLLSFARALAFDPKILVLDEATSSVDSELEAKIEEATDRLMAGRTSVVIAHRLSTIRHADRIFVLHHGRMAEEGSHAELLQAGGLYAKLHELQFVRGSAA